MNLRIPFYVSLTCLVATGSAWGQASIPLKVGRRGRVSRVAVEDARSSAERTSRSATQRCSTSASAPRPATTATSSTATIDAKGSAITRIVPFLELTNAASDGSGSLGLFFDLGAALTYREYLSNDAPIRDQRAFMPSAYRQSWSSGDTRPLDLGSAIPSPEPKTRRIVNVPDQQPITRDVNQASASVRWAPGGGRLAAVLQLHEHPRLCSKPTTFRIANSMGNLLTLDTSWKWLPKTALVLQISQGYIYVLQYRCQRRLEADLVSLSRDGRSSRA